jgi:hypothetical protein
MAGAMTLEEEVVADVDVAAEAVEAQAQGDPGPS